MKEEKIRVLALLPTEYAKMVIIDNTLEAMQQFVGGLIECLPMATAAAQPLALGRPRPAGRPGFYRRRGRGGQPVFFVRCHVRKVHKPV